MAYSRAPVIVNLTDTIEEMRVEVNAITAKLNELFDGSNNHVIGGTGLPAILTSPVLSDGSNVTGTYTLAGTPTITNPTINAATITGTVASTASITGPLNLTGAVLAGASPLVFEAATANDFELTIAVADVTADRTITLPDSSGTVALIGATSLTVANDGTIGSLSDLDAITITSAGVVTFSQRDVHTLGITIANGQSIGSVGDVDSITIATAGAVTFSQRTDHTLGITIGNGTQIGSVSDPDAIAIGSDGDVTLTQDLELQHDGAILSFGANDEITVTHVHDTGLLLNSTMQLQFNDASQFINAPSATILDINATDEIELNVTLVDVNANLDVSGTYTGAGLMTTGGNIVIPNAGQIGSASDPNAITISSAGVVAITATTANTVTTDGALTVAGGLGVAGDTTIGDDLRLKSDGSTLFFGADNEIELTHLHNDGLMIQNNSANTTTLWLRSSDTDVADGNILGEIKFRAPLEDAGSDAILTAASIAARSEGDFSATNNATELVFNTGLTEDAEIGASGGKMILSSAGTLNVTGGFGQGVLSKTANYTILSTDANIFLVTTSTSSITMTLPAASAVPGKVYRFTKADSGGAGTGDSSTGIVIIACDGSDTIGINANLTMELWYRDNYVDLMSDGSSRWMVVGTEMFQIPTTRRSATGNPNGYIAPLDTWVDAIYSTGAQEVPAGTAQIQLMAYVNFSGDGTDDTLQVYLYPGSIGGGHTGTDDRGFNTIGTGTWHYNLATSLQASGISYPVIECDINRTFQYNLYGPGVTSGGLNLYARGYRLG